MIKSLTFSYFLVNISYSKEHKKCYTLTLLNLIIPQKRAKNLMDKKQVIQVIAENVKKIMNDERISITSLARRCKVSTGTISKVVNGNMSITIPMAITISEGLDVDLSEIISGLINQNNIQKKKNQNIKTIENELKIGIISINNRRITCIQDNKGNIVGKSELEGGIDLVETTSHVMQLIEESINSTVSNHKTNNQLEFKNIKLNLVAQSYEFEDTRHKFINFANKQFQDVSILSDWQLTYLSIFQKIPGISLIVDKGISLSYMKDGRLKKLGGWKFPVYDLGGENWLGLETIRHTIEAKEGYTPMTNLANNILAKFNGKIERITEACFKNHKDSDIYSTFCEPLLHAYFRKDPTAQEIVTQGFLSISRAIEKIDSLTGKELKIAVNGSLADIYAPMLKNQRLIESTDNMDKATLLAQITKDNLIKNGIYID